MVREEMWGASRAQGAQYMGVNWVGPTIMRHGTPEQQRKHLSPIARGVAPASPVRLTHARQRMTHMAARQRLHEGADP